MSSPVLNTTEFALVADSIRPSELETSQFDRTDSDSSAMLTGRAIFAVSLLGAGVWYMLWKFALHFWMMR